MEPTIFFMLCQVFSNLALLGCLIYTVWKQDKNSQILHNLMHLKDERIKILEVDKATADQISAMQMQLIKQQTDTLSQYQMELKKITFYENYIDELQMKGTALGLYNEHERKENAKRIYSALNPNK